MQTYFQVAFQCSKALIFIQSNTVGLREPDTGRVDRLVWASRESTIQNVFPACKTSCHPAENVNETPVDWSSLSCPSCPVLGFFNMTFALFTFGTFSEVSRVHHFCLTLHLHIHLKSQYMMLYCKSFTCETCICNILSFLFQASQSPMKELRTKRTSTKKVWLYTWRKIIQLLQDIIMHNSISYWALLVNHAVCLSVYYITSLTYTFYHKWYL